MNYLQAKDILRARRGPVTYQAREFMREYLIDWDSKDLSAKLQCMMDRRYLDKVDKVEIAVVRDILLTRMVKLENQKEKSHKCSLM